MEKTLRLLAGGMLVATLAMGCSDDDDAPVNPGVTTPFTLQLLHFADADSNEAVALDAVDEFSALVDGFRNDATYGANTVVVSGGDNVIPGPRWFAAENSAVRGISGSNEPGHADHYMMNAFGVVASAIGNHELDQGPGEFADSIASEESNGVTFPGTRFPYLAANIDFTAEDDLTVGTAGEDYASLGGRVAPSATVTVGGEKIGLVGVSTPDLPSITTTGGLVISGSTSDISMLAAAVQPAIDALVNQGINKIIVLAHLQQLAFEKALASELSGVDIIVAGGSNTRMGDSTDALFPGDSAFDEGYPFQATDKDGNPILVVNVDGDYKYLGRLVVEFDDNGIVQTDSIDEAVSGVYASTAANVTAAGGTAISDVVTMRDALRGVITTQYDNVIGHTDVFIEGRRSKVRTEETNLGNLTADANKWYAQRCTGLDSVLSLKNGGGIRAEIGDAVVDGTTTTLNPPANEGLPTAMPGDVSEGHFRGTLRFDNGLVVLEVTGEELKLLLEHAVAGTAAGRTPGQFPQVGGIWFGYDPDGTALELTVDMDDNVTGITTAGTRVTDIYVDTNGDFVPETPVYVGGMPQAAATDTFQLVTLNFLANGGDSYPFALLSAANRRQIYTDVGFGDPDAGDDDVPDFPILTNCDPGNQSGFSDTGGEQDALAEYFIANYPDEANAFAIAETTPAEDRRIQDLNVINAFVAPAAGPAFTLQLLHFADVDSNEATALGAVDEFSGLVDGFSNDPTFGTNTILVSSGDNVIPGPRWFAAENGAVRAISGSNEPGHGDHYMMNAMGVVASAVGNHELDQGPGEFAGSIVSEDSNGVVFPGTEFPYLAANVDFSSEEDLTIGMAGQDYTAVAGTVAPSATVTLNGETIGIVGVSTPQLPALTTTENLVITGSLMPISELAAAIQPTVDALIAQGINKIVVLSHLQQLDFEKSLAAELSGVDIIVAGGSNTRMGDSTDQLFPGDTAFAENYPFQTTDKDGNPIFVVNVDGDYKYLGRLVVGFDAMGTLLPSTVSESISGTYASTPEVVEAVGGTAIPAVVTMRDALRGVIDQQYDNVIGHTDVFIEGRREKVRTEETNLGNLTADANKWYTQRCMGVTSVLSLKNGGGIRAEIGDAVVDGDMTVLNPPSNVGLPTAMPGDVSEGHMRGTLRFDNGLVVVDVNGSQLKSLLEHAVALTEPGRTPGRFPQVSGISFGFDPMGTAQTLTFDADGNVTGFATQGTRITDLYVDTDGDFTPDTALLVDGVATTEIVRVFPLVTLNFLANGGDDYPFALLNAAAANRRQLYNDVKFGDPDAGDDDIPDFPVLMGCDPGMQSGFSATGGEQDALAEYIIEFYPDEMNAFNVAETPPADDRRIQDLSVIPNFVAP